MALTPDGIIQIPGLASRWVRLPNGARSHYVTSGDTGPSVMLFHGGINGSSGTAGWRFMSPFLGAHGFRVFCPDRPTYGLADTRPEYWPLYGDKSQVDFVADLATSLCLDRFHIGGNSAGAGVAAQYTCYYPDKIISLGMIAANTLARVMRIDEDSSLRRKYSTRETVEFDGTEASMKALMEGIIYRKGAIDPDLVTMRTLAANRQAEASKASRQARALLANDPNYRQWADMSERPVKLSIPSIMLWGKQDVSAPVQIGYLVEEALPTTQFFYPDECGHQGQTDQPDMFNHVFLEFLRDGKVSRKTAEWAGVSDRRPELPGFVEQVAGTAAR